MQLVYGTTNKAKLDFMKRRVESLDIELLSLTEVNAPHLDIDESGNNPLENAKIKALAYYCVLHMPVFSCDSGLYMDEHGEKHYDTNGGFTAFFRRALDKSSAEFMRRD